MNEWIFYRIYINIYNNGEIQLVFDHFYKYFCSAFTKLTSFADFVPLLLLYTYILYRYVYMYIYIRTYNFTSLVGLPF